jgi:hypothetical protein
MTTSGIFKVSTPNMPHIVNAQYTTSKIILVWILYSVALLHFVGLLLNGGVGWLMKVQSQFFITGYTFICKLLQTELLQSCQYPGKNFLTTP